MSLFLKNGLKFILFFKKGFFHAFLYKQEATLMSEEFLLSSWITDCITDSFQENKRGKQLCVC
jgi:hypothetical protein